MEKIPCSICSKPKATLTCGVCEIHLCKSCTQFLDENSFSFLDKIPEALSHTTYCTPCFEKNVAEELLAYNQMMDRAKEILVFDSNQGKVTRLIKRFADPINVVNCLDHNETIMRLAFKAAQGNYNAIVDMKVTSEKVRSGAYQTLTWKGYAVPVNILPDRLMKDRALWQNPN